MFVLRVSVVVFAIDSLVCKLCCIVGCVGCLNDCVVALLLFLVWFGIVVFACRYVLCYDLLFESFGLNVVCCVC